MKEYQFKTGPLDRLRKLILSEGYVEYELGNLIGEEFVRMNKADISDFKHGMNWIVWYKFTVGREFLITFKDKENKELKIVFRSYFVLNNNYNQMYADIVDDIWKFFHQDIVNKYLDLFYDGESITVYGTTISQEGIKLNGQNTLLPWGRINIREYYSYFAVFDKANPETHLRVSYNEYETETLWSLIKTILNEKETSQVAKS